MKTSELKAKAARYMKIVEWSGVCDRQVTLWGRPPVCRFEGSPPPRHIFLQIKSAILILREYGGGEL